MKFQEHNRRACRDGAVHVFSVAYAAVEAFIQADDDLVALELEVLELRLVLLEQVSARGLTEPAPRGERRACSAHRLVDVGERPRVPPDDV